MPLLSESETYENGRNDLGSFMSTTAFLGGGGRKPGLEHLGFDSRLGLVVQTNQHEHGRPHDLHSHNDNIQLSRAWLTGAVPEAKLNQLTITLERLRDDGTGN